MADLTAAVEIAAKGHYEEIASSALSLSAGQTDLPDWDTLTWTQKLNLLEDALPYVTALHDAGLLKENTNG